MSKSEPQIEDIAAEWAVKVDAGALEPGEQAALDAWLDAGTRHFGAFARARAALAFASAETLSQGPVTKRLLPRQPIVQSRRALFLSAASLAACGTTIFLVAPGILRRFDGESYETRIGETQIVPLSDGSIVTLN